MVNNRGLIRIVEAVVAILIIAGVFIALSIAREPQRQRNIAEIIPPILDELAKDQSIRTAVVIEDPTAIDQIKSFTNVKIPINLKHDVKICPADDICGLNKFHENVYAGERIISSDLQNYNPKKIKLFIWQE